jgi:hypothetical protein
MTTPCSAAKTESGGTGGWTSLPDGLAVLVPQRPAPDLAQLLDRLGVDLISRDGDGFITTEPASGAASWHAVLPDVAAKESAARLPVPRAGDATVSESLIGEPLQSLT